MARIRNLEEQKPTRQELRNDSTASEAVLWSILKGRQLNGRKFRRQDGSGAYIVDFHCPDERMIVEVDGGMHDDPGQVEHDSRRDAGLRSLGLRILRFDNKQVLDDTESIIEEIMRHFTDEGDRIVAARTAQRALKPRKTKEERRRGPRDPYAHHP